MNVLVTGAGLVGAHVARRLAERGDRCVLFDRAPNRAYLAAVAPEAALAVGDVQDVGALLETMQAHRVEIVVHTAYLIGASLVQRPFGGVRTNVNGCLAALEAARLAGARRFLFCSTFGIYDWDRDPQQPIDEDFPVAGDRLYLASKIASERLLTALAQSADVEFAVLRLAQIYGRGHYLGGDVLGQALDEALRAALAGAPVALDPGVVTINDHVYVKDVAAGVVQACTAPLRRRVYNLGSGRLSTPAEVVAAIERAVPGARVELLPSPVVGPFWRHEQFLDLRRAREDLGYRPDYDIVKGLSDFCKELAHGTERLSDPR